MGRGAAGISKTTLESGGRDRRMARRAPLALIFRVVVNSMNSLPRSSTPRAKMGMAKGRRCAPRRSLASRLRTELHRAFLLVVVPSCKVSAPSRQFPVDIGTDPVVAVHVKVQSKPFAQSFAIRLKLYYQLMLYQAYADEVRGGQSAQLRKAQGFVTEWKRSALF